MLLEFHDHLGRPQRVEATRLVVYDKLMNPLQVAVEWEEGAYLLSDVEKSDFNQVLRNLGINRTVVCTEVSEKPIDSIRFDTAGAF